MTEPIEDHVGTPYQADTHARFGVRCSCGLPFEQGDTFPWTAAGKPSRKQIRTMKLAWTAYRIHWLEVIESRHPTGP